MSKGLKEYILEKMIAPYFASKGLPNPDYADLIYRSEMLPYYEDVETYVVSCMDIEQKEAAFKRNADHELIKLAQGLPIAGNALKYVNDMILEGYQTLKQDIETVFSEVFDTEVKQGELYLFTAKYAQSIEIKVGKVEATYGKILLRHGPVNTSDERLAYGMMAHARREDMLCRVVPEHDGDKMFNYPLAVSDSKGKFRFGYMDNRLRLRRGRILPQGAYTHHICNCTDSEAVTLQPADNRTIEAKLRKHRQKNAKD